MNRKPASLPDGKAVTVKKRSYTRKASGESPPVVRRKYVRKTAVAAAPPPETPAQEKREMEANLPPVKGARYGGKARPPFKSVGGILPPDRKPGKRLPF